MESVAARRFASSDGKAETLRLLSACASSSSLLRFGEGERLGGPSDIFLQVTSRMDSSVLNAASLTYGYDDQTHASHRFRGAHTTFTRCKTPLQGLSSLKLIPFDRSEFLLLLDCMHSHFISRRAQEDAAPKYVRPCVASC